MLDEYEAPVYRFFYYSEGNRQIAQDQCGETFARFAGSIKNFKSDNARSLRAFIFGIARNILLDTLRKKRLAREDASSLDELPSSRPSVFRQVRWIKQLFPVVIIPSRCAYSNIAGRIAHWEYFNVLNGLGNGNNLLCLFSSFSSLLLFVKQVIT